MITARPMAYDDHLTGHNLLSESASDFNARVPLGILSCLQFWDSIQSLEDEHPSTVDVPEFFCNQGTGAFLITVNFAAL